MLDMILLLLTLALFGAALLYVSGCERLKGSRS